MKNIFADRPEVVITVAMLMAMSFISLMFGLKITMPSGMAAIDFGAQALLPLVAIGLWAGWEARAGRKADWQRPILAVLCYAIVIIVHFNMKLWVPFVRPVTYDMTLWRIDKLFYPVVRLCGAIDAGLAPIISHDSGFYVGALPVMFYISLAYYACTAPDVARKFFLSALILQALGALSYYLLPALGPFLFEDGTNPVLTDAQHNMFVAHQIAIAAGPGWLAHNGPSVLFAGLGAMPSLHAASSFLFLWFAWRHGRILLPTYIPLFLYILVVAVAARWHYLVDIPAGIALARLSIFLAYAFDGVSVRDEAPARVRPPVAALPGMAVGMAMGDGDRDGDGDGAGELLPAGAGPDVARRPFLLGVHSGAPQEARSRFDVGVREEV